jgi:hypothetical protein
MTALSGKMQQRRDTAANWTSNNPTLASGELGLETDTRLIKMGDGSTAWTSLAYTIGKAVSYTPTWTNITVGSSTNTGSYVRVGNLVLFSAKIVSAASFAITGAPGVSYPVTAAAAVEAAQHNVYFLDAGANHFPGFVLPDSASTTRKGNLSAFTAGATYVAAATASSTIPFTWSTGGDTIIVSGWYVAA